MALQVELEAKLDLSGKGKKKGAAKDSKKGPVSKNKGKKKKSKKPKRGQAILPAKPIDISVFDPADMSGRYKLDLGAPAAVQVLTELHCAWMAQVDTCIAPMAWLIMCMQTGQPTVSR